MHRKTVVDSIEKQAWIVYSRIRFPDEERTGNGRGADGERVRYG